VNKIDGEKQEGSVLDFYRLGVSPLYSVSAEHGRGMGELMDEVIKALPPAHQSRRKSRRESGWRSWAGPTWENLPC